MPRQHQLARKGIAVLFVITIIASHPMALASVPESPDLVNARMTSQPSGQLQDTPRAQKREALTLLRSVSAGRWSRIYRDRAIRLLNGTLADYRDDSRVSRASVYSDDRQAIRSIDALFWRNETVAGQVLRLIVAADLKTVNTTIDDAQRARRLVRPHLDDPEVLTRGSRHLRTASRFRNRALKVLPDDDPRTFRSPGRRVALSYFRRGWIEAQRAIDAFDLVSTPIVTIETRSDPAVDGPKLGAKSIRGSIIDVRAYELGNVSVTVNGSPVASGPVVAGTAPGRNGSFAVNITIEASSASIAISTIDARSEWTDRNRRWASQDDELNWRNRRWFPFIDRHGITPGRSSDTRWQDSQVGTNIVRFDGDGLPDTFEIHVVGTDPLNADSDARVTDRDEGTNGIPDGGEDLDGDGLTAFAEFELGTNPLSNDSDCDTLPDRFEAGTPVLLNPNDRDTDSDQVVDGQEDFDGDGLSAASEFGNSTSIASRDTDNDGLSDFDEIVSLGTNPLLADTDGDGLRDGTERRLDTDLTSVDTDGDGIRDGDETYTTTAVDKDTGARVSLAGLGDVASQVDIDRINQPDQSTYLASPVIRVRNHTAFERATVTLALDADHQSTPNGNLSVYTWNPDLDRAWHPISSVRDRQNGTISANTSTFSYFAAMDVSAWQAAISDTISLDWPRSESFDDLGGWEVVGEAATERGVAVISGEGIPRVEPDIVVAKDGSGDYERIRPAVNEAGDGDTVLVREGTYRETVVIDTSIRLLGRNVTINGEHTDRETGIWTVGNASATISGFTIRGYQTGINGRSESARIRVSDTVIEDNRIGLDVRGSGYWTLNDVDVTGNSYHGLDVGPFEGNIRVLGSDLSRNGDTGLYVADLSGAVLVRNTPISGNGAKGAFLRDNDGTVDLREAEMDGNGRIGIGTDDAPLTLRLTSVDIRDSQVGLFLGDEVDLEMTASALVGTRFGIYADRATGQFRLRDVQILGKGWQSASGIKAAVSTGDWSLEDVGISDFEDAGIFAANASGDWRLEDVQLSDSRVNLLAPYTTGHWVLVDTTIEAAWEEGIDAVGTSGEWQLDRVTAEESQRDGLNATRSAARWDVSHSRVVSNTGSGIVFVRGTGAMTVSRTAFHRNGVAIDARNATTSVIAIDNWWGQTSGPTQNQTVGDVQTTPFCRKSDCLDGGDQLPDLRNLGTRGLRTGKWWTEVTTKPSSRSLTSRTMTLPSDAEDIRISARFKGRVDSRSTASVVVKGGEKQIVLADIGATTDRFEVESRDISDLGGETVSVELVATGNGILSVDWIDVAVDTDGDGLRDAVEEADLGVPAGPHPGETLFALDPYDPDSDGDGLLDGEELVGVRVRPDTERGAVSVQATEATSDPTRRNSDGGGLDDGEERAFGSNPFVLETLVTGYTVPTMTMGPADTLEDRGPMTVAQANGLLTGVGRDSSLIMWPSRQFFDPIFCIKELTAGPGCAPSWMKGVTQKDEKHYVYVPFVVFAESNADLGAMPYQMSISTVYSAELVKGVNISGTVRPGESSSGYFVFELPEARAYEEAQPGVFRSIGAISVSINLTNTIFERENSPQMDDGYVVPTSTLLPATEEMLDDTQLILEQGINVALAADSGATVAAETGSSIQGAIVFLFELARSQTDSNPLSIEDIATKTSLRGIGSFKSKINQSESQIYEDIYGEGVLRPVGPTMIRQN